MDPAPLANVTVLGVEEKVNNVTFNGETLPSAGVTWNETSKALSVTGLRDLTPGGAWKTGWVLKWA